MRRIEVYSKVREYPEKTEPYRTLVVSAHWNSGERIVLEVGGDPNFRPMTVYATDLMMAIKNALNAHGL